MKNILFVLLILIISVFMFQCEDSGTNSEDHDQSVHMWIRYSDTYELYDQDFDSMIVYNDEIISFGKGS